MASELRHLRLPQGLDEVVLGARGLALVLESVVVHGGHDDDRDGLEGLVALLHDPHELHAVNLGHHDVGEDEVSNPTEKTYSWGL